MTDRDAYVRANRDAWNEAAPRHAAQNQVRLLELFAAGGYNHLDDALNGWLERVGVEDKSIIQLCCNNGVDLLSAMGMGARSGVGVDQAGAFLDQAREIAEAARLGDRTRFVESDIYALPDALDERFDIALTTIGVLGWMPDLPRFFSIAAAMVKPGGWWLMEETHPVVWMYDEDPEGGMPRLRWSYFHKEPIREDHGLDYFSRERYAAKPTWSFTHTVSDILNAGVGAGLRFVEMREVDYDISNYCAELETLDANPPQGLYLLWRKPEET